MYTCDTSPSVHVHVHRPTTLIGTGLEPFLDATRNFVNPKHLNCIVASTSQDEPTAVLRATEVTLYAVPHPPLGAARATTANASDERDARGSYGAEAEGGGRSRTRSSWGSYGAEAEGGGHGQGRVGAAADAGAAGAAGASSVDTQEDDYCTEDGCKVSTPKPFYTSTPANLTTADGKMVDAKKHNAETVAHMGKLAWEVETRKVENRQQPHDSQKKRKYEVPAPVKQPLVGSSFKFGASNRSGKKRHRRSAPNADATADQHSAAAPSAPSAPSAASRVQTSYIGRMIVSVWCT